jgi:hypothetical protein
VKRAAGDFAEQVVQQAEELGETVSEQVAGIRRRVL